MADHSPRRRGWARDFLPAILGLLLLVAIGIGSLVISGGEEEPEERSAAATTPTTATTAKPAPETTPTTTETPAAEEPERRRRAVRVPLQRIRGGLGGRATVVVRRTRRRGGTLTVTARVPKSKLEVHLVKRRGPSKVLLTARGGPATVTRQIPFSTFRRYRSIDVLARRLPTRRGRGRVRSLRVRTAQITRRLDRMAG